MSKYASLWGYVKELDKQSIQLSFQEIEKILGFPIDHSFLNFKKELLDYGFQVKKISMKGQIVFFEKK